MPGWEDLMNCVCQNAPQRPGVQEILDTLQRSTVCTGTQCFETEAEAFGLTNTPCANSGTPMMFYMMMMCVRLSPAPPPPPPHTSPCRSLSLSLRAPALTPPRAGLACRRFMMMVAVIMQLKKRTASPQLTNKPGSSSSHANEPPPPPPLS